MRFALLDEIEPGTRLGRDLWGGSDVLPLLRAGCRLSNVHLERLRDGGIAGVYIDDDLSRGIDVPTALREQTRTQAASAIKGAMGDLAKQVGTMSDLQAERVIGDLDKVVAAILDDLESVGEAVVALSDLSTVDAYTMKHSIDVTVLGLLLGRRYIQEHGWIDYAGKRRYDRMDSQLQELGLGLLLHDIGKLAVPIGILQKAGPLDPQEWQIMRSHCDAGVEIVKRTPISFRAIGVIHHHHERFDGSGYPEGLAGDRIHLFARIAAIADVYDAMVSDRPYKQAAPPSIGWSEIVNGGGRLYDPEVVSVFRKVVPPFPPGAMVLLSNGAKGIVAHVPPDNVERPVVRVVTNCFGEPCDPHDVPLADAPDLAMTVDVEAEAAAADAPLAAAA